MSRETSPLGTAVVSVTKIAAGEGAYNVIPDSATFGGTLRSLAHEHLMYLKQRMEEVRLPHYWNLLECAALGDMSTILDLQQIVLQCFSKFSKAIRFIQDEAWTSCRW